MPAATNGNVKAVRAATAEDDYYSGSRAGLVERAVPQRLTRERERLTPDPEGMVLVLVGLPARGKSFISRRVERFLQWRGLATKTLNVGKYRRDAVDPERSGRSDFFDSSNAEAVQLRERAARDALADGLRFLDGGGDFVILDATNSTRERRKLIVDQVRNHCTPYAVLFVEAVCDDREVVELNIRGKVENSPDFRDVPVETALADLRARIAKYEEVYESVQDDEGPYIRLYNLSSKVMVNHCYGRIAKSVLPYLMAIHIGARPIWLVRAGPGQRNPQSPGSDRVSKLSASGERFAEALAAFVEERSNRFWQSIGLPREPTQVVTSTMPRAVSSVSSDKKLAHEATSALNPIDKGSIGAGWWDVECEGEIPPWERLEYLHPDFFSALLRDPLRCRFPGGESYLDVIRRLESVLIDAEMCTRPVLIVSHITVLQLLFAYFKGVPVEESWKLTVPKGTVLEVTPTLGGGFACQEFPLVDFAEEEARTSSEERPPKRARAASDI